MSTDSDSASAQRAAVRNFREAFKNSPKNIPIHKLQEHAARPRSFKGPIWVSNVTIPAVTGVEGDKLREMLWEVFQQKRGEGEVLDYPTEAVEMYGEWVGLRKGEMWEEDVEGMSEEEKFRRIGVDCESGLTVFYLSGNGWM